VSHWDFEMDVKRNHAKLALERRITLRSGKPYDGQIFFVPPYEHWNSEIAHWARGLGYELVSYTPGTRSNADYTEDGASNFVSSQAIFDSILARERDDPHGLNGFLLLLHLGAGPKRTDKFHTRFDELLTVLAAKGYQFVRVDELLEPAATPGQVK
jgi:endoglucanase